MLANGGPLEAIAVKFTWEADAAGTIIQTLIDENDRTAEDYDWTTGDFLA